MKRGIDTKPCPNCGHYYRVPGAPEKCDNCFQLVEESEFILKLIEEQRLKKTKNRGKYYAGRSENIKK
jgi:hypothetical protein